MLYLVTFLYLMIFYLGQCQASPVISDKPSIEITVSTSTNIRGAFNKATKETPCYLLTLEETKNLFRGELEMIIACKAIYAAGIIPKFTIVASPNYSRSLYMVENGDAHMSAETIWEEEIIPETMLKSIAVVTKEVLEKGVYALDSHPMFQQKNIDLTQYKGTTVSNWFKDVDAIKKVTQDIYLTYRYSSIYIMLQAGRVDFTLLAFPSSNDLSIVEDEGTFKPVPNVKVQLDGKRHFILSKRKKKSRLILSYLNKGIEKMRQNGELQKLFYAAGLANEKVKDWQVLN